MSYYATNAVYRRLETAPVKHLVWASGNAWILVYADPTAHVRTIVFVSGNSMQNAEPAVHDRLSVAATAARALAMKSAVPYAAITFDDEANSIDGVRLDDQPIGLAELKTWFSGVGLAVNSGATRKEINSAESSAYHNWQRNNLGAIKVSDVDLIRWDGDTGTAIELLELKRSFYALEAWRPYPQDFPNFNVLANLASRTDARFTIAYNRRVTSPQFLDDASRLSLFAYSANGGPTSLGQVTFEEFTEGQYLR